MNRPRSIAMPLTALGLVLSLATTMGFAGASAAAAQRPGVTEANITRLTTEVLERSQFAHHPFDSALACTLLDRYLDALDGTRALFLQSDVDEFAAYGADLAEATRGAGDTAAAQAIFARYLQRLASGPHTSTSYAADREVRLHRTRPLSPSIASTRAAARPGGGPRAVAAAAPGGVPAGEAGRQAAGADREHADEALRAAAADHEGAAAATRCWGSTWTRSRTSTTPTPTTSGTRRMESLSHRHEPLAVRDRRDARERGRLLQDPRARRRAGPRREAAC